MTRDSSVGSKKKVEVIEYSVRKTGLTNAATYDAQRYTGPAKKYKQQVMANAYWRLLEPLQGKCILDVGCGTGRGVIDFAREASFAVGSDASHDMLSIARRKASSFSNCFLTAAIAQGLPFRDGFFDVVISLNFLHLFTLDIQKDMITEMKRVLKPGGLMVLEFDNALHGVVVGPYKRWAGKEEGSLPGEIRHVIGNDCYVEKIYGAVFPVVWRLFHHFPRLFLTVEKLAYFAPFNRLAHRVYYKLVKQTTDGE